MIDFGMTFTDEEIRRMAKKNGGVDSRERRTMTSSCELMSADGCPSLLPIEDFHNLLRFEKQRLSDEAKNITIKLWPGYDQDAILELSWEIDESDEDVRIRVRRLLSDAREGMSREAAIESQERAELARLKAKYEQENTDD